VTMGEPGSPIPPFSFHWAVCRPAAWTA